MGNYTGQRVLLVDQEEAIRSLMHLLLAEEAYRVEDTTTEGESWERFLTAAPTPLIVVFNYSSPYHGQGALLRRLAANPALLVRHGFLCFSLMPADRLGSEVLSLLAQHHIPLVTAPFDVDDFLTTLNQIAARLGQP